MKLSVSGWPGGGSSTLSILLCYLLEVKHVRGSDAFRAIYRQLSYLDSGNDRIDAHNFVEPYFGPIYDKFIDFILSEKEFDNLLVESDIAAFRVGKISSLYSIFLFTDFDIRKERMSVDSRIDDNEVLKEIDKSHEDAYRELHGINWFNEEEIKSKHAFTINNSNVPIAEEINQILEEMKNQGFIDQEKLIDLKTKTSELEKDYWEKGKKHYTTLLEEKGLVMHADEILRIISVQFSEEISKFPRELQDAIQELIR